MQFENGTQGCAHSNRWS